MSSMRGDARDERRLGRLDADRARIIADGIAREARSVGDTMAIADRALLEGLAATRNGDVETGYRLLARSLIATALAAWQLQRLAADAQERRDAATAVERRAAAERQLAGLPGRAGLAADALAARPGRWPTVAELRDTTLAFVAGSGVAAGSMSFAAVPTWMRMLEAAFERPSQPANGGDTARLGVPGLTLPAPEERTRCGGGRDGRPRLSAREREVLGQIVLGLTTAEIAYRLGVKATTVSTLVGRIFNKLGVNNRPAAVALAIRQGLCAELDELAA